MSAVESPLPEIEDIVAAAAPEAAEFGGLDLAGLGEALVGAVRRAASRPAEVGSAVATFCLSVARTGLAAAALWLGAPGDPPVAVPPDRRFADPAWAANPFFFALRQCYLAAGRLGADIRAAGRAADPVTDAKAELAAGFVLDALAPTNFLLTNPAALKRAFETGGTSVVRGAGNFVADLLANGGMPRRVDTRPFELGVNLAATPGKVVFANDLMELIQYAPQASQVRAVPVLASPPWTTSTTSWISRRAAASLSGRSSTSGPSLPSLTATRMRRCAV
jgi:polyhydroxyalkanoate synthase subunit PhaC